MITDECEHMNNKALAAIAVVVIIIVAAAAAVVMTKDKGDNPAPTGDSITVTDSSGREVMVDLPVSKVAITDPTLVEIFAMAVGEGWENYVCLLPEDIKTREPAKWDLLQKTYPKLADVPLCKEIFGNQAIPSEKILEATPDLVLLPGATIKYLPNVNKQVESLEKAGIPCLNLEFYDLSFTDGIAESNYGIIGDIMGTSETADRVVDYYERMVKQAKDRIATSDRQFSYYVEIPQNNPAMYGNVVAMGCPEFNILGGKNICDNRAGVDMEWNIEKMQNPTERGPDYIVMISSGYYGADATLGYGVHLSNEEMAKDLAQYTSRVGWDTLQAVESGNVMLNYGELRNSVYGLVDLYSVAMMIHPDLFTQKDLDGIIETLDSMTPYGFDGTWSYRMGA